MADPKKVRWSQLKVGVLGIAAFLILFVLVFLLTSSHGFFQKNATLYPYLHTASGIATEVQTLLADVRHGHGTISKLIYDDSLYQELRSPIKRVDAILADLQAGNGSAGKLLKDPALYDEAKSSLAEIRHLLTDLN